jgi:hypothetical protein
MKQFITIIGLIFFMGISAYLLLNEKKLMRSAHQKKVEKLWTSPSKAIGEKPRRDFTPYQLQKMRIASESTFRFENTGNNTVYELNEEELERVARQLSDLKMVNHFDREEGGPPVDVARRKKDYYEVDGQE